MTAFRFVLGLAVGVVCWTTPASAILIEYNGTRVGGFLQEDDGTTLKIATRTPDGREKVTNYTRDKVKILHKLDVDRLEKLSKNHPRAYRDYAEELARQEADPEAVYYAKHLYLIAAHLAPKTLGGTCLRSMSKLSGITPAEARKYRAMAMLLDPKLGPDLLKEENVTPADPIRPDKRALDDFRKALQHYRTGNFKDLNSAITTAKQDGMEKVFAMAPGKMDRDKFVKWCEDATCKKCPGNRRLGLPAGTVICPTCKGLGFVVNGLRRDPCKTCKGHKIIPCPDCGGTRVLDHRPDDALCRVLRAELWAMDQDDPGDKGTTDPKSWSAILQSGPPRRVLPLSLETIVPEFDPHKCLYRNGKWGVEK